MDYSGMMRVLFIGDLMCHDGQLMEADFGGRYDFERSFMDVRGVFGEYDHVIGNLETVLTDGPYNGFPKFSTPKEFCGAAVNAGVDCIMLANNHICDMGFRGVKSTVSYLKDNGIMFSGVGLEERSKPLILGDLAVLNYTNRMNVKGVEGVIWNDMYKMTSVKADAEWARSNGARVVVMFAHWGKEYEPVHSTEQETIGRKILSSGVDMIIGSHPHVIQDWGVLSGRRVVYSLGNFISSQTEDECSRSIGVVLTVDNGVITNTEKIDFRILRDNGVTRVVKD